MGIVYKPFFKQVFADSTIENNLSVKVIDKKTNTVIYNSLNIVPGDQIIKSTSSLSIANREWLIESSAPIGYGLNNGENMQPWLIILMAQLLSILLVIIFIWQNGQRKHASNLVAIATKGLEIEQKRVLEMNQKDEAVLNSAGEGIISFDIHGKIIIANESALRLLGISKKDEVVGQSLGKVIKAYTIAGKSIPQSQRLFSKALRSSEIERITMIYKRKDGTTFPVRVTVAPVIMDNKSIGAVDIFSDITSEVQLNKAKDEFLSLASHQLRTPLTAIKWYIEAILDKNVSGRLNEKQSGIIEKIDLSNQRMIKLVTSLLDVSRIESGRLIIQIKPTNYKELILSVLQESSQNIKEKHQNIIFNYDKKLTDINLDDNLIRQVVSNLVVNANRYSPDGTTIEIAVEVKGDTVLTTIKDQGYGIPEKQQSSIFNKFFRADNAISKDPNGNGLGLYLVKSIIKESGGHIWFTSELDKGSTFYFVLPLKGVRNRKGDVSLE
jgi:PAS domain S-box-containing protein